VLMLTGGFPDIQFLHFNHITGLTDMSVTTF
jgi:hypothetical protein